MMSKPVTPWPSTHLESVPNCPVCDSPSRELVHDNMTDVTFGAADGEWSLWRCNDCGSGYLDPRPDEASIGDAYSHYYTHSGGSYFPPSSGTLRNRLANGYRNWRYGLDHQPSSILGIPVTFLMRRHRTYIDQTMRHLPRASDAKRPRILDIGCGNGAFLAAVRETGWEVAGVEPDPVARAAAVQHGLDVRESLADFAGESGAFGYVTLFHVIEHLHRPTQTLETAFSLLGSGGGLFIATPNMDAVGHQIYGRHWRGLEVPRHLVLFSESSLRNCIQRSGFGELRFHSVNDDYGSLELASRRIEAGHLAIDDNALLAPARPANRKLRRAADAGRQVEILVATAARP